MFEYLNDYAFLQALDKMKIKVQYAKIILLNFKEEPIKEIEGKISSGSLNVNGSAAIRRTINLSMLANINNSNIENIDNEISLNKKIKIYIGYKNPFIQYTHYGDIIWFPCGMYVIATANVSRSTSNWNISITAKDKMVMLDGTAGGKLTANTTFHEKYIYDENGDIIVQYPTLIQIIKEAVHHLGGEDFNNIYINDLENTAKLLVKYIGDEPIYFSEDYGSMSWEFNKTDYPYSYKYGEDIGYRQTDFTYPGELILGAGDTVVTLLDKICGILGNFEYFYDIEGKFIFQEKKNYLNTSGNLTELTLDNYYYHYSNTKYEYAIKGLQEVSQITKNPKYDNIKNDYVVWGKRKTSSGIEVDIRYHLAIDAKPLIDLANQYMWAIYEEENLLRYDFSYSKIAPTEEAILIAKPCTEWREELYRQALLANAVGDIYSFYDAELLAEWRNLFDTMNEDWEATNYWNPDVFYDPRNINYWLDFIDTGSEIGKYSVSTVGRRSIVENNENISALYTLEVPDVIFMTNEEWEDEDKRAYYNSIGQKYFKWTDNYNSLFATSSSSATAFERIRELLYQHLSFNASVSLTCFPKYYLEPNNIIYIEDIETGIIGNYSITQFTLPLTYNGTMSISATEVLTRV